MKGYKRFLYFSCLCIYILKQESNASDAGECHSDSDCGENALCSSEICVCKSGYFENPPTINAETDGCLGECDQFGETYQCEGNMLCTQSSQGYGVCSCPENTYGPPQCHPLSTTTSTTTTSTTTETPRRIPPLIYGALTIPLIFLVPAALASSLAFG